MIREETAVVTQSFSTLSRLAMAIKRHLLRQPAETQRPLRVLVVDDEPTVTRFVVRVLTGAGITTWSAAGGGEALRMVPTLGKLDLLLTDLMMPSMNGDELARRLRGQTSPRQESAIARWFRSSWL